MQENQQIVIDAFVRWSRGEGSILDLMGDDGVIVIPGTAPHCGTLRKNEFVNTVATPFMKRFSKPPVPMPSKIFSEGEDVIVIANAEGITLKGSMYRNTYVFVLEFSEGRLVKATEFLDMLAFNAVWDSISQIHQGETPERETR